MLQFKIMANLIYMTSKFFLVYWMFVYVNYSFGQTTKAIYFDADWAKTDSENASYYREVKKEGPKLYLIQDFYLNGQVQMSGHYHDKKGSIETGTFTYYDSTGAKEQVTNYRNGDRDGLQAFFYSNGVTRLQVSYSDGLEVGDYSEFYESGELRAKAKYINGDLVGELSRFYGGGDTLMSISLDELGSGKVTVSYQDGNLLEEGYFIEGLRDGIWYRYNRFGNVLDSTIYNELEYRDQFLKEQKESSKRQRRWSNVQYAKSIDNVFFDSRYVLSDDGDSEVTYFPEVQAMFLGGTNAMKTYIRENVVYPIKALKKNKEDRVYVSYVFAPDG